MNLLSYLFTLNAQNPQEEQRRSLLNLVILFSMLLVLIIDLIAIILIFSSRLSEAAINNAYIIVIGSGVFILASTGIFFLNRLVRGLFPGLLFLSMVFAAVLFTDMPEQVVAGRGLLAFSIPIMLSSFIIAPFASIAAACIVFGALCIMAFAYGKPPQLISMSVYFVIAFISWIVARSLKASFLKHSVLNTELEQELAKEKLIDSALTDSRRRAQAIFENTLNSVFLIDSEGAIADMNPAAEILTGYSKSELLNTRIWRLIAGSSMSEMDAFAQDPDKTERARGESLLLHKTGKTIPVEFLGVARILPEIHLAVIWDISERVESERILRESQELLAKIFESLKAAIFVIQAKNERIVSANKSASEIFGYSDTEFSGKSMEALHINPASWETFRSHFRIALERKGYLSDFQYRMKKKDGSIFPTEHTVTPLVDSRGETTGWVSVVRDITERKRLEEQLAHAQKMDALGRLAGGITHDFNNLLTTIFGYCDIGRMNPEIDNQSLECLGEIKKAAERAALLTSQLLAFSRKQILETKPINVNELITNLKTLLTRLIVEDISIEYRISESVEIINADPVQIEQIIINLVVNACDAMEAGGLITIETKNCYLDEENGPRITGVEPGNYVMLAISDTGSGMDEPTLKRIFDPFFTTKEYGKGTGLSLSIVFGIVKQSGGCIDVTSEPGRGTTFKLYFPRNASEPERSAPVIEGKSEGSSGNENILIIEDDEGLRKVIVKTLKNYGYNVAEASTGAEAIELAKSESGMKFDLLVTDVIMPGMSGKEAADRLEVMFPGIAAIFISGYTDNVVINHGIENGGCVFLQKPFSPDEVARKVRETLDKK